MPGHWVDKLDNLPEEGLREINHLNTQLVQQLKSSDTAFSLGMTCVEIADFQYVLFPQESNDNNIKLVILRTSQTIL